VAVEDSEISRQLQSQESTLFGAKGDRYYWENVWSRYYRSSVLGYSIDPVEGAAIINSTKIKMRLSNSLPVFLDGYDRVGAKGEKQYSDFTYLRVEQPLSNCPDIGDDYVGLYQLKRDVRKLDVFKNDTVIAYSVSKELDVKVLWSHSFEPHEELSYTHPVLSRSGTSDPAVIVSALSGTNPVNNVTVILNGRNGDEVWRSQTKVLPHFSMPLVFDEYLLQPTPLGIEVFRLP
jgi:hypothetical protein